MRMPKDLQAHVAKYLRNHFTEALSEPDALHLAWPLHPPTATATARDIGTTQDFIRAWQRWPHQEEVTYEPRNWSRAGLGTNNVPTRITINGAERIATAAGLEREYSTARQRAENIAAIFPDSPDFAYTVHRSYTQWKDLSAYDLRCLAPCLTWLRANPHSGEWERAVSVEGVDGKWIGNHRRLLLTFLAPFGITDLGLRRSDTRVRLRYLNHTPAFSDIEIPLADAATLFPGTPPRVLIVENKQTFLALPTLSDASPPTIALLGSGTAARQLHALNWLHQADITYWGDLDAAGFAILNAVRAHFPHTTSLLMDTATVTAFQHLAVPDPGDGSATLTHLTTEEQRAYRLLFTQGRLRIEQERIPFADASTAIHGILGPP
ncbi:DUF3322 domain-containing protein [Corynebacterium striatum]|uniref:DUF3322 domain-containing protein n=1 Tax=Corynebacterium striatum TaxID=43770 RepID=UPI000C1CCA5D|nr:DUF3322 domain-containing protein [Corynebacterium striatum]MBD0856472.1 hypothetical protein [Corynebacterium striatum]PIS65350.1 hypothetical protein AZH44_11580 [Corynebacterium striatum]PXY04206.1 hypothetical protein CKF55_13955 [Corynebacterium striatum]PXY06464.1 hypothetical protein CKF53_04075 [Corynebacterium striatum]PXY09097.1 hypothetical protein CKF55_03580 [Corynebacterium striatum]